MLHYYKLIIYVLEFHAEHIGHNIRISDLASLVALSEFHFSRIFKLIMKESPGRYICRQKMELAKRLIRNNSSITILALSEKLGYSTPENFSTAFKRFYGITPNMYKLEIQNAKKSFHDESYQKNIHFEGIRVLPDQHVIYTKILTTDYQTDTIYSEFKKIIEFAETNGIPVNQMFGIRHDDPLIAPADKCKYDVCIVIDSPEIRIPDSLYKVKSLKECCYAVFLYKGKKEALHDVWDYLVNHWEVKNGFTPVVSPLIETFSLADQDKTGQLILKLYMPVGEESDEQLTMVSA